MMRLLPIGLALGALVLLSGTSLAGSEGQALAALRQGGHVALMRHGDAPGGAGDPPGFRLDDCRTQRNLSAKGRADARSVGLRLQNAGVVIDRVVSSPWCRCLETARLMDVGAVEVDEMFGNAFVWRHRREALAEGARAVINKWRGPGTLLVVTHGANIQALTGTHPASGEIVVVAPGEPERLREVGRLGPPPG